MEVIAESAAGVSTQHMCVTVTVAVGAKLNFLLCCVACPTMGGKDHS